MTRNQEKEFTQQINEEMEQFKQNMLGTSKNNIYENSYRIQAYDEISDFLINNAKQYSRAGFPKDNIVESLYFEFLDTDYDLTQEDLRFFISKENETYKKHNSQNEM